MIPASTEGRLLLAAFLLFVTLVGLSILGERTLILFGGDRVLAARVYKTLYVGLGGGMLGLAAPALVAGATARLRSLFARLQADGVIAETVLYEGGLGHGIGYGLMVLFVIAGGVGAVLAWRGIMWPGE